MSTRWFFGEQRQRFGHVNITHFLSTYLFLESSLKSLDSKCGKDVDCLDPFLAAAWLVDIKQVKYILKAICTLDRVQQWKHPIFSSTLLDSTETRPCETDRPRHVPRSSTNGVTSCDFKKYVLFERF